MHEESKENKEKSELILKYRTRYVSNFNGFHEIINLIDKILIVSFVQIILTDPTPTLKHASAARIVAPIIFFWPPRISTLPLEYLLLDFFFHGTFLIQIFGVFLINFIQLRIV